MFHRRPKEASDGCESHHQRHRLVPPGVPSCLAGLHPVRIGGRGDSTCHRVDRHASLERHMEVGNTRGSEHTSHARIVEMHPRSMDERAVPRWSIRTGTDGGSRTSSPSLAACSRRSCSRTLSTRPVGCANSVTGPGPRCCGRTMPGSAMGWGCSVGVRSTPRAMVSLRRSTSRPTRWHSPARSTKGSAT